ncbi:ETC complex I subunit [Thermopetrobacter sp. TC1]|uniref:ETC complex I subunit n=1 Tax=Thermopetrobacter sp. TC1 TaxID=1495045 RepID=UPI000571D377|nr:ETC complex I subunit [Thermopetrobacter sp. TC1]
MLARIYRPSKNAMQSGRARSETWVLEFEPEAPYGRDPLMGWTTMRDVRRQISLRFPSREAAEAYAQAHGIPYRVLPEHAPRPKHKAYADNFRFGRKRNWTH